MTKDRFHQDQYSRPIRRLLTGLVILILFGLFLFWRIDGPRVERIRAEVADQVLLRVNWLMTPVVSTIELFRNFQSYQYLAEQNRELRTELRQMNAWKEAALQLEQENARLLDLNNVRIDPRLTYITGNVVADSGSPFRQSVLLNIGSDDGVIDGWAAMDGIGLVGRISGVGKNTSRVLLLNDATSSVPATIQPSGQNTLVIGDNSSAPLLNFIEDSELVRPGDRVVSSGDGGVFPPGLLIGQVALDSSGKLRLRLSADFERLKFLRLIRYKNTETIDNPSYLVFPNPNLSQNWGEPNR
ncbi:MAG: rod shape-determining protein MreC [Aestuariivita sp.]|nr:rod shape-determining protein MreC [Aestuariivita sp.]